MKYLVLLTILMTGCQVTKPEQRCIMAGLDVTSMDIVEEQGQIRKALVRCKREDLMKDFDKEVELETNKE